MLKLSCIAVSVLVLSVMLSLGCAADTATQLKQHKQEQLDKVTD